MTNDQPVRYEDMAGVRSRVSWGAVLGGAVIALACSVLLTFFFASVGLSLTEAGVRENAIGIGAIVAAVLTVLVSLFVGGWITTQLTAGETNREAVIYGLLTWALVTGFSLATAGMGVRAGYFALLGGTMVTQNAPAVQQRSWEENLRALGVSDTRIAEIRRDINPDRVRAEANDPANQERARQGALVASWTVLVGTLLSVAAAVGGACVGCGPTFRLFPAATGTRQEIIIAR